MKREEHNTGMHRRRITLSDGRYLIFYTFDDGKRPRPSDKNSEAQGPEPTATPQAEEEKRV
jgi:hypothetical protein